MTPEQLKNIGAFLRLVKEGKNNEPITNDVLTRLDSDIGEAFVNESAVNDRARIIKEQATLAKKEEETKLKMQMGKESIEKLRKEGVLSKEERKKLAQETLKASARKNRKVGEESNFDNLLTQKEQDVQKSKATEELATEKIFASEDFEKLISQKEQKEREEVRSLQEEETTEDMPADVTDSGEYSDVTATSMGDEDIHDEGFDIGAESTEEIGDIFDSTDSIDNKQEQQNVPFANEDDDVFPDLEEVLGSSAEEDLLTQEPAAETGPPEISDSAEEDLLTQEPAAETEPPEISDFTEEDLLTQEPAAETGPPEISDFAEEDLLTQEPAAETEPPEISDSAEEDFIDEVKQDAGESYEDAIEEEESITDEFALEDGEEVIPYLAKEDEINDGFEVDNEDSVAFDDNEVEGDNSVSEQQTSNFFDKETYAEADEVELDESEAAFVEDTKQTEDEDFISDSRSDAEFGSSVETASPSRGGSTFDINMFVPLGEVSDLRKVDFSNLAEISSSREEAFEAYKEGRFNFIEDASSDIGKDDSLEYVDDGNGVLQDDESGTAKSTYVAEGLTEEKRQKEAEELMGGDFNDRSDGAVSGDAFYDEVAENIAKEKTAAEEDVFGVIGEDESIDEDKGDFTDLQQVELEDPEQDKTEALAMDDGAAVLDEPEKPKEPEEPKEPEALDSSKRETTLSREAMPSNNEDAPFAEIDSGGEISPNSVNDLLGEMGSNIFDEIDNDENLDDEDLGNAEERQHKLEFDRALGIIETYTPKNKKIILSALESDVLDDEESNIVAQRVLNGDDEDYVAAYVANREYLKTFREDPKKDVSSFNRQQGFIQDYYKKQRALKFLRLVASVAFLAIFSFVFIFFGIDYIRSSYYYFLAYKDLQNQEYLTAEEGFEKAYGIRKNLSRVNDFGLEYARRGRFESAEKKYLLALQENADHRETLLNYGDLHIYTDDFIRAQQKFKKLLVNDPKDIDANYGLARTYIEWGTVDSVQWAKGGDVLTKLVEEDHDNYLKYLAKKLEISSLSRDFETSKFYFTRIKDENEEFYDRRAFRRYTDFLIDNYAVMNTKISGQPIDYRVTEKNNYTVGHVEANIRKMFAEDPNYFPVYFSVANWFDKIGESEKGEKWLDQGISIFEKNNPSEVYLERYTPVNAYNLKGKLEYYKGDYLASTEAFSKAIEFSEENSFANYYLGKIELSYYNNLTQANNYFSRAYASWNLPIDDKYRDLVYAYGYVHYQKGLELGDEEKVLQAIQYWSNLMDDPAMKDSYVVEFALAQAYLRLKKYELGEAFAVENVRKLQPSFDYYKRNEGRVVPSIRESVGMLSDSYNNLGVAYAAKAFSAEVAENRYIYKQKAVENFVNSITLKEELELLRGVPYANFNRINEFPQRTEEFLISDQLLAKTLLP